MKHSSFFFLFLALSIGCKKEPKDKKVPKGRAGAPQKAPPAKTPPLQKPGEGASRDLRSASPKPFQLMGLKSGKMTPMVTLNAAELGLLKEVHELHGRLYGTLARKPFGSLVYDLNAKKILSRYKGVAQAVTFSPSGTYLAVNQGEGVDLFSLPKMQHLKRFTVKLPTKSGAQKVSQIKNNNFVSMAFSQDSRYLATGEVNFGSFGDARTQTVSLWDLKTKQALVRHTVEEGEANACDVVFSPGKKRLFAAVVGGSGKGGSFGLLFPLAPRNMVASDPFAPAPPLPFALPCDDCVDAWFPLSPYYIVTWSKGLKGEIQLYNVLTGQLVKRLPFEKRAEEDSVRVASLSADKSLLVLGISSAQDSGKDEFGNDIVQHIPYSYLLVETASFAIRGTLPARYLVFHPASPFAARVHGETLQIMAQKDLEKPLSSYPIKGAPLALAFSQDGTKVLLSTTKELYVLNVK